MNGYIDTIICGDCLDVMAGMESECVDLVVTDPPYGISFMGKAWDKALPSVDVWRECLRVLKPGAFAFVMCIPRQDCLSRMIINLEDAGFMVNVSPILWTYATGFPKAANLSKLADKRAGAEREVVGRYMPPQDNPKNNWSGKNAMYHREPEGNPFAPARPAGTITAPATPEAKALEGAYAGFQPKPCYEVVLVAMKPCTEKTYLDQALSNGHGCTHLDAGRIPTDQIDLQGNSVGRFAPNLLCSDDVLNDGRVTKSGVTIQPVFESRNVKGFQPNPKAIPGYNQHRDSGSYSRYFSLDAWAEKNLPDSVKRTFPFMVVPKASKSEKNSGLDELEDKQKPTLNEYVKPSEGRTASKSGSPAKNHHPTCKPIKLMSYLIAIGSRPGDVVCDPYAGSGTTGVAAAISDRRYILMELDAEYVDIAEGRIAWHVDGRIRQEQAQLKRDLSLSEVAE